MSRSGGTYKCGKCREEFEYVSDGSWSEDEAMKESKKLFGNVPKEQLVVVCDDCFIEMEKWRKGRVIE